MEQLVYADDGFFFGLGAFETIAVEDGRPALLPEHIERMLGTLSFLGIDGIDGGDLEELAREGLSRPDAREGRKVLKLTATQDNVIATLRVNHYTERERNRGFSLVTSDVQRNETSPLTRHKTLCYGDCILQKRAVKAAGYDEPIFLNTKGLIAEGATTNIIFSIGGRLVTPRIEDGILPGIMRGFALSRFDVEEAAVGPDEAEDAEEVMVTNSLVGFMPVSSWDGRAFDDHRMAEEMQLAYEAEYPPARQV